SNALKISANSVYGETGYLFSPFYRKTIASSVTAFSRETIKKVITFLESKQCNIIYGDTDSVFFTIPETHFSEIDSLYSYDKQLHYSESIKKSIEFTKQITPAVNSFMEQETGFPFMKMAYEKVLHPSLFLYKKQY
ncbi:28067_t:CDS:1, partial [Dentiscutata erythropus]